MTMFDDIANAIGQALNADKTVGGYVAGATFTIVLIVIMEWTIGEDREGITLIIAVALATLFSAGFGWYLLWIPLIMSILLVILWLERRRGD